MTGACVVFCAVALAAGACVVLAVDLAESCGKCRCGNNGNGEQRCGNCLQHVGLLFQDRETPVGCPDSSIMVRP